MQFQIAELPSPLGPLAVVVGEKGLCLLEFGADWGRIRATLARRFGDVDLVKHRDPGGVVSRLRRYLEGDLAALDDVPVDPGGTDFQQKVWKALRRVPAGRTISYGELARRIGSPAAMRAVGAANGANPVPLVVPCHRVIGADGALTGYGGGMPRKEWLLRHEGAAFRGGRQAPSQAALPLSS
jgi:methylated-DNA-[protein]-cysteine S-methyltransferase